MMKNKVLVLGSDGYIGAALCPFLTSKGYNVVGVDNENRKYNVESVGGNSLTDNVSFRKYTTSTLDYTKLKLTILDERPATIINLAQQPSAPFSMRSPINAAYSQINNLSGSLNVMWAVKETDVDAHIIQIGTAGEFPDWLYPDGMPVPEESRVTVQRDGKDWIIPTPRYGGSWYHLSKTYSSLNADYACRIWGLRITDINQGIVYGHRGDTRFDYDEYFGTVVNRFVTQAVAGIPLTIYGKSGGQMRSFINLQNSIQAIELLIRDPAEHGEFRTVQQLTETHTVKDVADMVQNVTGCDIQYIDNPRMEMDKNKFNFAGNKLKTLGLETIPMVEEIPRLVELVKSKEGRINKEVIMPKHSWR